MNALSSGVLASMILLSAAAGSAVAGEPAPLLGPVVDLAPPKKMRVRKFRNKGDKHPYLVVAALLDRAWVNVGGKTVELALIGSEGIPDGIKLGDRDSMPRLPYAVKEGGKYAVAFGKDAIKVRIAYTLVSLASTDDGDLIYYTLVIDAEDGKAGQRIKVDSYREGG